MKDPLARLFATSLLVTTACAYETDEIYYKEIPPVDPSITFVLSNYDDVDTIILNAPENFNYEVNITPGEIEKVELMLDDRILLTSKGGKINYPFGGQLMKSGTYDLTIQFTARTGTESLAESRGGERLHVSRTWTLIVQA